MRHAAKDPQDGEGALSALPPSSRSSLDDFYATLWSVCEAFGRESVVSGNPATYSDEFEAGDNPTKLALDLMFGRELWNIFHEGCNELERQITLESTIGWQDYEWHLFRHDGESLAHAQSLKLLILALGSRIS